VSGAPTKRLGILLIAVAWATACSETVASDQQPLALTGLTVIDGTGAAARPNHTVVIESGRFVAIGPDGSLPMPDGARVLNMAGKWAVPGYIDVHAHMPDPLHQPAVLRLLLAAGVTSARSPAAVPSTGVELRRKLERGELLGPRFLTAGRLIDAPNSPWSFAAEVSTEAGMRTEIAQQAAQGVDFIKLYSRIPPDLLSVAVAEAHARGLPVIGHLGRTTWQEAAAAGIDALTHSWIYGFANSAVPEIHSDRFAEFFQPNPAFNPALFNEWPGAMDLQAPRFQSLISVLAQRRITIDPNLVLAEAVAWGDDLAAFARLETEQDVVAHTFPHPYSASWSVAQRAAARTAFTTLLQAIRAMHEGGVIITVGTDLQNPWMTPGVSYHRELELLAQAGLTPADVLRAATRNGAVALGIQDEAGTIEVGKSADLVVLGADPLSNIANARLVAAVVRQGRLHDPVTLVAR
jgi:imidazolonepropionase-like amidohydrolase